MKILVFSNDFPPNTGGAAVFLQNICTQLIRLGHQVDVLALERGKSTTFDQKQPYRVFRYSPSKRPSSFSPIMKTLFLHFKNHYDLVFMGNFATTSALGVWILNKLYNIRYIILSHGNDLWKFSMNTKTDKIVAKMLIRNASLVLANSLFTAKRIQEEGYSKYTEILYPGVDENKFYPGVGSIDINKNHNLQDKKVLFSAARLTTKKNIHSVLKALPIVIKHVPQVHYLIAGDGEDRERLEELRDKLGLQPYISFLGNVTQDQLPSIYAASDLFVLPSYDSEGSTETFGIAFLEASACGKPVIAGRTGGAVEAVIEGKTGLLVDPNNENEIADKIIYLLKNQTIAHQLGKNGRERVVQELNWNKVGERLDTYIHQVVNKYHENESKKI